MRSVAKRLVIARLPLRWRLTLASFGLLAILLAALGTYVSITEEQTLFTDQAFTLHQETRLASGPMKIGGVALASPGEALPVGGALSTKAITTLTFTARRLTGADIRAVVLSPTGVILLSGITSPVTPASVSVPAATLRAALAQTPDDSAYTLARGRDGRRQILVLFPLVNVASQTIVAVLQVSAPITPIENAIAQLRLLLALGILVTLGIAAALTLPLVTAGLRPLNTIARASRRIAAQASQNTNSALSVRLEAPTTHDEIGRLTESFNVMVAQLDATFARQKQFVADASHELRTPLTVLAGSVEMLLLGADRGDPDASRRLLRGMYREVDRLQRLVDDLLTLTRLDDGRAYARLQAVQVAPLLADAREQLERLATGQRAQVEIAAQTPPIYADPDWMRQVLLILVDNALKHTPSTGLVTLRAGFDNRADTDRVTIEVRDTGEGIASEFLPHVFERFYRGDAARTHTQPKSARQRGSGAGLGLSIALRLVEAQQGQIHIQSGVGRGTTVRLSLPAYLPAAAALEADTSTPISGGLTEYENPDHSTSERLEASSATSGLD